MGFQFRRDSAINWAAVNPVLSAGEPAYELDTRVLKIGDGVTAYNQLQQYGGIDQACVGGRLSLIPNLPVNVSWGAPTGTTAGSTLWYVPYVSDKIALWSGTNWQQYTFNNTTRLEIAGLAASTLYDVFAYQVNGVVTLSAVSWTSNTKRSVALVLLNGVLVRTGMANMRYIGTFRTNVTAGTTADFIQKRLVYNHYNQVQTPIYRAISNPHTYSQRQWRIWNNTISDTNVLQLVLGVRQPIHAFSEFQIRHGYAQLRFMAGIPYTTFVTSEVAAGSITLPLAAVDNNVATSYTTVLVSGWVVDPLPTITAINGNVVTITTPTSSVIAAGTPVSFGPISWTVNQGANLISPTELGNQSFISVTSGGAYPSHGDGGFCVIAPAQYGLSSSSFFQGGLMTLLPFM